MGLAGKASRRWRRDAPLQGIPRPDGRFKRLLLGLVQVGGFGIMTLATLLALLVRKNLGLRGQLVAHPSTATT